MSIGNKALLNRKNLVRVSPTWRFRLITQDPDDNKFVDCAFAAGADFLVSEDNHFKLLNKTPFPQLNVVSLDEFLENRLIKYV